MAKPSTAVATAQVQLPVAADLQKELEDLRARLTAPSGDKIKVDNKQFTTPNGDVLDALDVVIVDFAYYNAYYTTAFDANNIVPPECFALSLQPKGIISSANSPERQNPSCDDCWANAFGSAQVGSGKACRNHVILAVLPRDATAETPLSIVIVSPTGIKPFAAYVSALARAGRPPYSVVTHITCDANLKYDSLRFGEPQPLEDEEILSFYARKTEAHTRLLTEPDVSAIKAANEAKPVKGRLQPPKKAVGRR